VTLGAADISAYAQSATADPPRANRQGRGQGRGGFGRFTPGPPAPVPDAVAMPRPTQEELARINAALKTAAESSPEKDLLTKFASLVAVDMPRDNPCIRPTQGPPRLGRHDEFVEIANNEEFDILFLGDSITDWWRMGDERPANAGGRAVQEKHFADVKIANFGVAGDTTQGVLWGLQNGEGQGHKPKAVMLMIGTNNTGGASGPEIAEGVGAVVLELRKNFPDAKIMLLAIFPRGAGPDDGARKKNEEANAIIAKLHDGEHVFFHNINDKFLREDGSVIGFWPDNLHPGPKGYEIWANAVAPTLKEWIK
jgi:lysophospholipase L1-like esterase